MSEAYILACVAVEGLAQAALHSLLERTSIPANRVQEMHWFIPPTPPLGELDGGLTEIATNAAILQWSSGSALEHYVLQSTARALQCGERALIVLGQSWENQSTALLLSSPSAVGRYNLLPKARISARFSISAAPDTVLGETAAAIQALAARQAKTEDEPEEDEFPTPDHIHWIASTLPGHDKINLAEHFSQARWLPAESPAAGGGDCFLLNGLLHALEENRQQWGLLISAAAQQTGNLPITTLVSLIERL